MHSEVETMIIQQATGAARGPYDKVSFNVRVEGRGDTGPLAKSDAQRSVAKLRKLIERLKTKVTFEDMDNTAHFEVQQQHSYDSETRRNVPDGYIATFTMNLVTKQVEHASEILDALTSEDGLTVDSPDFSVCSEKRLSLQEAALQQAWDMVNQRLATECRIIGVPRNELEVCSWNTRYNDGGREPVYLAAASMSHDVEGAGGGGAGPLVESGAATVNVTLNVTFRRKIQLAP